MSWCECVVVQNIYFMSKKQERVKDQDPTKEVDTPTGIKPSTRQKSSFEGDKLVVCLRKVERNSPD